MTPEKAFAAAQARFKAAETDVAKLTTKLDAAKASRVEAAMTSAAAEGEVTGFGWSTNFDAGRASHIVATKQNADAVLDLLDRGIEHLEVELANAKIDALSAARECATAQARYHDTALDEQTHKWLRANAKQLQALSQQLHLAHIFARIHSDGPQPAYPPTHVENLFLNVLPRLVSNEFADDDAFREGCQASLTGAAINQVCEPKNITDAERSAITSAGNTRAQQVAALRTVWQPAKDSETQFDRYGVEIALNRQRHRAESLRRRIDQIEERVTRAQKVTKPSLPSTLALEQDKTDLDQTRAELERTEQAVSHFEQQLQRAA